MTIDEALEMLEAELPAIHTKTFSELSSEMLGVPDLLFHAGFLLNGLCTTQELDDTDRAHEILTTLSALMAKAYGLGRRSMLQ